MFVVAVLLAAALQQDAYTARQTADVVQLEDLARQTTVSIMPARGNIAFEMKVNGHDILTWPNGGIPLLAPWANRLDETAFHANGKRYAFDMELGNVRGPIPIHGLLQRTDKWRIVEVKSDAAGAWVTSRLDFANEPAWMKQWPFPHTIEITHLLRNGVLEVRTKITNHGQEPMPISIGFHPYFRLTDAARDDWTISVGARTQWLLAPNKVPTGATRPIGDLFSNPHAASLRGVALDDVFADLERDRDGRSTMSVRGKAQRIDVVFGPNYKAAVIFAPAGRDFICFEPMAAITNALNLAHRGVYKDLQSVAPGRVWEESFWIQPSGFTGAQPMRQLDLRGDRFAPLTWEQLDAEQRTMVNDLLSGTRTSLGGPFNVLLRSPEMGNLAQKLGEQIRFRSSLPARLNEMAILLTAQWWASQYEWHAHKPLALKAGLNESIADDIQAGRRPASMRDDEAALYDFSRELREHRRVSDATFQRAVSLLGERGVVDLIGVMGYYDLVSMALNVDRYPLPAGAPRPFPEPAVNTLERVDHLVYATPDLQAGIDRVEQLLGVRATPGGPHPGRGTRNALIALGPHAYIEIIGPDPEQPKPAEPRPFGIDGLKAPRLVTWSAKERDLAGLSKRAAQAGVQLGELAAGSRRRPDGVLLSWNYTNPRTVVADGIAPFFIDWGTTPHPAASAVQGGTLIELTAEHPDPARVATALTAVDLDLPVKKGSAPALIAIINTPRGRVELR